MSELSIYNIESINNPELRKLYLKHLILEKEVERFEEYAKYSDSASIRHKYLKKEKLRGKEELIRLISKV
jgi:uncharacterized protein YdcH (DUF465 family)